MLNRQDGSADETGTLAKRLAEELSSAEEGKSALTAALQAPDAALSPSKDDNA
ncbi:hypothetical protein [Luteibacter sp. 9133]|uniref:hypothetical protein n=1 Tax=Luteibacter sp. 9133 TaxID=1500891 RepID=UPI000A9C0A86|nr:hypothetical protein [Luteibacter sp. 9133]